LRWVDDESNDSRGPDRNFLRHEVAPLLDARFPGWRRATERLARHAAAADGLLDELARIDHLPVRPGAGLALDSSLPEARRANVLRAFLALNGLPMPSEPRLVEMSRQLHEARGDARVRIRHAGIVLVRHRGRVLIEPHAGAPGPWRVEWRGESRIDLGPGRGVIDMAVTRGQGIGVARRDGASWYFAPRRGGERIRLDASRPTRTLKNLLQEHHLPAGQRAQLPLLFHGERLVWVPGVGISAEYACDPAEEGFFPSWTVAGRAAVC
jgi:tRNA(Ile)-lysidine synthase